MHACVTQWSISRVKCTQITLAISMPKQKIFHVHTKTQDCHLTYPNVDIQSKCHNVDIFHLKKLLMLVNGITLAISRRDTLKPPSI